MSDVPVTSLTSPEHDRRVDYVEIAVRDVDRARSFYRAAFGWTFTDYGPDYTSFHDGRLAGGLRKDDVVTSGSVLVVFFALDLEETLRRVVSAGGKVAREIHAFPGGRRFHFTDSEGTELAIWSDR